MAPTEAERFQLREGLRNVLEEAQATTLMDSLPPMDWHELATKTDLAALEERMDARFEVVDVRLEALRTELGAKIDTGLTDLNAKIDTGLADGSCGPSLPPGPGPYSTAARVSVRLSVRPTLWASSMTDRLRSLMRASVRAAESLILFSSFFSSLANRLSSFSSRPSSCLKSARRPRSR